MSDSSGQNAAEGGCCGTGGALRRRVALTDLRPGEIGVVEDASLEESDAAFLRAMGLCNEAKVRLCRGGEPCIVAIGSFGNDCGCGSVCRIGLARPLAQRIFVTVSA